MGEFQNLEIKGNIAQFKLKPGLYQLDIIYAAAYMLLDRAFVLLDGDPATEVLVQIRAKKTGSDLNRLVEEFNEELINYAMYKTQSEKNADLRAAIMKRVMITNKIIDAADEIRRTKIVKRKIEDPENILKPYNANNKT